MLACWSNSVSFGNLQSPQNLYMHNVCVLKKMLSKYQVVSVVLEGVLVVYKGKIVVDIVVSGGGGFNDYKGFQGREHGEETFSGCWGKC